MKYKKGHRIKPKEIRENGAVVFTNGTNDCNANQVTCEAYGYTWSRLRNRCEAFRATNEHNKAQGSNTNKLSGNKLEAKGSENTFLTGQKNKTSFGNLNCLITGQNNEIQENLHNTTIIGGRDAKALRQGEVMIGGGADVKGYQQMSFLQLSGRTSDATATRFAAQGTDEAYITTQANSILGFEIFVTALCTGGSDGTAGDFKYQKIFGAVRVDNGNNYTITQTAEAIASTGDTGTVTLVQSVEQLSVQVTGVADRNINWGAYCYFHEIKTSTTF